ncbi:hypothetical protein EPUS_04755 [Endocarpon pusillum Z07020]|uniref:Uncharacterized protein n=1 Tax=Endocarpon pusillum (strain Z07020 / HMAS-L-300199) TaxID=1263415 RepID=U1G5U5_ENDPU|nr:uncharacterized protein EPUS_04755 [Endocarpon pusillum Z07020]ERF72702.1 hypothetical protein EPUS_04755 [Endocarpon pusillum Z07020]
MPDVVKSSGWRRKKNRDGYTSGSQRLLTGPEMAEEDAVKRERRELAQSRERTKEIQRQTRRRENKHAKALLTTNFENNKDNDQRPYQSSATATISHRPPLLPPVQPYQYSQETQALLDKTQALLDKAQARESSPPQPDSDEDEDKRERTPPVIDDADPLELEIMESEGRQLFNSGGTAPPLWSLMPEFAGITRAARPGTERSERERKWKCKMTSPPPPPHPPPSAIPFPSSHFFKRPPWYAVPTVTTTPTTTG